MCIYLDPDADLSLLQGKQIAVIGYGNQGRAQALNLRDSGLRVLVGNRADVYMDRAREDSFSPLPIAQTAAAGDVVMLLIPDEVMPEVFEAEIAPHLAEGKALMLPELWVRLREGLADIRSGRFAKEWAAEQQAGCPTLEREL